MASCTAPTVERGYPKATNKQHFGTNSANESITYQLEAGGAIRRAPLLLLMSSNSATAHMDKMAKRQGMDSPSHIYILNNLGSKFKISTYIPSVSYLSQ